MTLPPTVIGAIRVSTDIQQDRYGPTRQREDILREAERAGLTITRWVEEAISGTDHERAAVNTYYDLARQHPGLNVIFSHPNRVGRHVEVTVGIARQLHARGATVWIAGMGSLRDKRNWRNFLRDAAEAESDHADIVERLQRGKYSKAAANRWPHGQPPYGYRIVRDERGKSTTIEPNERASVVQTIFKLLLGGMGSSSIALHLNEQGIPSPRPQQRGAAHWTHRAVLYTARNAAYTGRREFHGPDGEVAVLTFPALITTAEYQQAQAMIDRWNRRVRPARTRYAALFAGHARCSLCGGGIAVYENNNTSKRTGQVTRYTMYRCRNTYGGAAHASVRGGRVCAHNRTHRMERVDEIGWQMVIEAMTSAEFLSHAAQVDQPPGPDHSARLAELRGLMAEAVTRAVTHHLPDDVLDAVLAPLRQELSALERDARKAAAEIPPPDMTDLARVMQAYLPTLTTLEERREVLDTWQVKLHLGPDGPERVSIVVARA